MGVIYRTLGWHFNLQSSEISVGSCTRQAAVFFEGSERSAGI